MGKGLKDLKRRFVLTMYEAAENLGMEVVSLKRDDYVRGTVDFQVPERLNKEELNLLGGFKVAKNTFIQKELKEIKKQSPKILVFDIETAPIKAYVWGLWNNDVGLNQINSDWHLLSWAAKWYGDSEDKVMYMDQRNKENIEDDSEILGAIWKLLDEADIVITQNGRKFDQKKLNARFIINGFLPPSSYKHIDTCVIAKKHFGFTSNKLAYLTDKLCKKYKKLSHAKFTGFSLWEECLKNNIEAWKEMEEYNKYDVLSLEELSAILMPWDNGINFNIYHDSDFIVCECGSLEFRKAGFYYTNTGKFQKYV